MDWQQIAVGVHLVGFALGLGGATISDITFFKVLMKRNLEASDFAFLTTLSKVIWAGLSLLILSGLTIFALIYSEQGSIPMLASPKWQAKLTLVGLVLLNGVFFKLSIFPALRRLMGQKLALDNISPIIWRLAVSGTISISSWYSILVISLLPRTFRPAYLYFMGAYLVLLAIGILMSKMMIQRTVKAET